MKNSISGHIQRGNLPFLAEGTNISAPIFLKKTKESGISGIIMKHRKPDESAEQPEENQALKSAARDILDAVESRDVDRLESAIRAAFQICDSEDHVEGEHIEEEQD